MIEDRYGELVWLKVYDFPFWPAIVLHPQWLSESLTVNLKLNKKKTQNRLVAQFFDDVNSSYFFFVCDITHLVKSLG